ncbi:MAG: polysaccharide deacetylase family protein [Chitinispirillales bacterium]|jgi:peptidoglycan/xylan/chitin deacetylase (PgdA/CDA1 family)|nr:polysaccharide deacetylase family protein [Chitinispirillales bacterium]
MVIFFSLTAIPFFIGLILLCFSQKSKKTGVLLFHRISKKHPKSLSQISAKQLYKFCEQICLSSKKAVVFSQYSMQSENNISIVFDDGDKSVFDIAYPILKKYNLTATVFIASGIIENEKIDDFYSTKNMMSAENIKELSDFGWEIASHGVRHLDLTLLDENDLYGELVHSKAKIEKLTGKPVSALSFPYGSWNEKIVKTAQNCGYEKFAVYRKHKFADEKKIIPATAVYPFDNSEGIKRKISGEINGITKATSLIVPHFAKGTPMFFWNKLYKFP